MLRFAVRPRRDPAGPVLARFAPFAVLTSITVSIAVCGACASERTAAPVPYAATGSLPETDSRLPPGRGGIEAANPTFKATTHHVVFYTAQSDRVRKVIGTAAHQTCWLGGLSGDMISGATAGGGVFKSGGNYVLEAQGVPGGVLYVTAVCVNSVIGRTETYFWNATPSAPATVMAPVTERRQCFLASVFDYPPGFASLANYVRVYQQSGSWKLFGKLESIFGPGTPIPVAAGYATAVCLDLPPGFFASAGERAATPPTSIAADVGYTACGLTGVRGRFSVNNAIQLTMPPSKPGEWTIKVTEGNIGEYACLQRRRHWGTLP